MDFRVGILRERNEGEETYLGIRIALLCLSGESDWNAEIDMSTCTAVLDAPAGASATT